LYLSENMKINDAGHLQIAGIDAVALVKEYGSPLYVLDEQVFRKNCRKFRDAFSVLGDSLVIYASKTLSCLATCAMVKEEGLGLDIVSGGELYTALQVGFPAEKIYFHGNNKTKEELRYAVSNHIGRIVVDSLWELELLDQVCKELNQTQDIMLRISPGIEAHTHEYIKTGQIDCKFGFTLSNGQALEAVKKVLQTPTVSLIGIHCHIGSQIFEMDSFRHAAEVMVGFLSELKQNFQLEMEELDLGGGFGIYYSSGDEPEQAQKWAEAVMNTVKTKCQVMGLKIPKVIVEPGRAIAGPAGTTLYTVGSIKDIPGIRKYVSVDGGMTDNPRPILYQAKYEAIVANKADREPTETVSIAGHCCESGDMLIWDIELPAIESGDIIAVSATGAYNYSMASNYNKFPRPAMVLVNDGTASLIIKRESYQDIVRNEIMPEHLASK
jgi:diaminopimelate decarboxylase